MSPSLSGILTLNEVKGKNPVELRAGSAKGLQDFSVAEFTLSKAEALPQNDPTVSSYSHSMVAGGLLVIS